MVPEELIYIRQLIASTIVKSPCLETGAGLEEHSLRNLLRDNHIEWFGTDVRPSEGVFGVDLGADFSEINNAVGGRRFRTVLICSVLEHVFDPVRVLDNVIRLVESGGHCVVITPTVWPLHYFPLDCWRVNPGFYEEYAKRRGLKLVDMRYVTPGVTPIDRDVNGQPQLPPPDRHRLRYAAHRAVHRVMNTFGRRASFPAHVLTGAAFRV